MPPRFSFASVWPGVRGVDGGPGDRGAHGHANSKMAVGAPESCHMRGPRDALNRTTSTSGSAGAAGWLAVTSVLRLKPYCCTVVDMAK